MLAPNAARGQCHSQAVHISFHRTSVLPTCVLGILLVSVQFNIQGFVFCFFC
jgi:hypothetical protein